MRLLPSVTVQPVILAFSVALLTLVAWFSLYGATSASTILVATVAGGTSVFVLSTLSWSTPQGLWAGSSIYLVIFSLFHFGLLVPIGMGMDLPDNFPARSFAWLQLPETRTAALVSVVGLLACSIGIQIGHRSPTEPREFNEFSRASVFASILGFAVIFTCLAGWSAIAIASGGIGSLVGSYGDYLAATADTQVAYVYFGIGVGIALVAAGRPGKWRTAGAVGFALFACIALPLGLRGEVLFALAAGLVVYAKKKIPVRGKSAVVMAVLLLIGVAGLRQVRQTGLSDVDIGQISVSPLAGLMELGSSLRPVTEVVRFHNAGENFLLGAGYWAPVDRALVYIIPGWTRPRIEYDDRVSNVMIAERVGEIGFSVIAEGYRNGGIAGVALIMVLIGIILGKLDRLPASCIHRAAQGVILVPLFIHVRNSFLPVPSQIAIGLLVVGLLLAVDNAKVSRGSTLFRRGIGAGP